MNTLTEAQRNALREATCILTDQCFDETESWFEDFLPPRFRPFYTGLFMHSFAVCIVTVAWKLFAQGQHMLGSVAEEMALNALIQQAKSVMELDDQLPGDKWDDYAETAFEDFDFETLWDDELDGVEVTEIGEQAGIANLSLRDWFKPFDGRGGVHAYVADFEPGALKEGGSLQ